MFAMSTSIKYITWHIYFSQLLQSIFLGQGINTSACENSDSNIPQELIYPINQIIMCNIIGISINTSQVSVNLCLKNDIFPEYWGDSYNYKNIVPYRRVSVDFFKWLIFPKWTFVDTFHQLAQKRHMLIFWWNKLKLHNDYPHCDHSYSIFW